MSCARSDSRSGCSATRRLQLAHQVGVAAEREIGIDPRAQADEAQLLEALGLADRELLVADVLQRRATPQPERVGQQPARRRVVAAGERVAPLGGQALEPLRVDDVGARRAAARTRRPARRSPPRRAPGAGARRRAGAHSRDGRAARRPTAPRWRRRPARPARRRRAASRAAAAAVPGTEARGRRGRSLRRVRGSGTGVHDSAVTARDAHSRRCDQPARLLRRICCRRPTAVLGLAHHRRGHRGVDVRARRVATAAGVLLVASQLLSGIDHSLVLAFLAATYVLWGLGLRANLRANWLLLRRTGTSTNVLSKAAFELTRRRGPRTQAARRGRGIRRHRARQGGAVLRRRVRRRGPDRQRLVQRRAALPRGREPRGGRLRVRPRAPDRGACCAARAPPRSTRTGCRRTTWPTTTASSSRTSGRRSRSSSTR